MVAEVQRFDNGCTDRFSLKACGNYGLVARNGFPLETFQSTQSTQSSWANGPVTSEKRRIPSARDGAASKEHRSVDSVDELGESSQAGRTVPSSRDGRRAGPTGWTNPVCAG